MSDDTPAPEADATAEAQAGPHRVVDADPPREAIVDDLREALGADAVLASLIRRGDLWVRVATEAWRPAVERLKATGFDMFCFLGGIDWLRNPELTTRYERWWPEPGEKRAPGEPLPEWSDANAGGWTTGVAGGDTRFQVLARLYDVDRRVGITLKADLDSDQPRIDSLTPVYRGADWHERETWEMFGFEFTGHPGLRHIYLPAEFEGHPLRKDFPLLARAVKPWPGLVDKEPIPGEDEEADAS